jgi:D-alanyl-lipoteichoic acid acyltransferase DltB (MBOAT superfamily)
MNFNSPYKADSITDFWHRWHISLSTWLRDYLYISLGGNRKGKVRTYINLCLTMLLGGLWHGASWNFVIWGGFHGIALAAQKFWRNLLHKPKTATSKGIRKFFAVLITFNFVCFRFPFFFLYGPSSFHQRSCHISPFSPLHFLCSVMLSSISALPCIVRLSSSNPCLSHSPYVLSFFHIIMYAHVCGCGSAASFASLQVSSPLYIIKGTENK